MTTFAISPRRTAGLAKANARLLIRNRLTLVYGIVLPLLPLALLLGGRGDDAGGAVAVSSVLMLSLLFPVYYNVLSAVVTRRDELVLKRLRSGETRDLELLVGIALPGAVVAFAVAALTVPLGVAFGLSAPLNPLVYAVGVLAGCVLFAAFAVWTAAWTRTAEAAQMTSMPVILLAAIGTMGTVLPEGLADIVTWTPGGALDQLVRVGWFGMGPNGDLDLTQTWFAAVRPLGVLLAWTVLALWLAKRSMRWEPRT